MNKKLVSLSLISLLSVSALAADKIVASWKGHKVTESQVTKEFESLLSRSPNLKGKKFSELDKELQTRLVKGYVNNALVYAQAQKAKIKDSAEYKRQMKSIEMQIFMQKQLDKMVTETDIKKAYTELAASMKGKKEVKASHILVESESEAKKVLAELKKGAKFADLAKKHSKDSGSKVKGGELGFFAEGMMVPEFSKKAFSMKKGEVSAPVKTDFGWHIIKLEDMRDIKVPSEQEVSSMLKNQLQTKAMDSYISKLEKESDVKILLN